MGRTSSAKERLLRATSHLLWEKSYYSVTVDEICARAGVLKGSLYHFFDSKASVAAAALRHLWDTVAKPVYEEHFSSAHLPLERIRSFLDWLQLMQRERYRDFARVLGCPIFTLGCELGAREQAITETLCDIESAQLCYFESAIRDAMDQDIIERAVPRAAAISLRATVEGIMSRARRLNDPDELSALTVLPMGVLRLKHTDQAVALPASKECGEPTPVLGS